MSINPYASADMRLDSTFTPSTPMHPSPQSSSFTDNMSVNYPVSHGHLDLIPIQAASTSGLQLWQQTHGFSPVPSDSIRDPNRITHRFPSIFLNTFCWRFPCAESLVVVCGIPHLWDLPRLFNPQRCLLTPSECVNDCQLLGLLSISSRILKMIWHLFTCKRKIKDKKSTN